MKSILTCVGMAVCTWAFGQDITTNMIQWRVVNTLNTVSADATTENTLLTTDHANTILWQEDDGTVRKTFQVLQVLSPWTNVATDGMAQFKITDGTTSGVFFLERHGNLLKATIVLGAEPPQSLELSITTYKVL